MCRRPVPPQVGLGELLHLLHLQVVREYPRGAGAGAHVWLAVLSDA